MTKSMNATHYWRELPPKFEEPVWWGVALFEHNQRRVFVVKACSEGEAYERTAEALSLMPKEPWRYSLQTSHYPELQTELESRYADRDFVEVMPYSVVELPEGELTAEQQIVHDYIYGGGYHQERAEAFRRDHPEIDIATVTFTLPAGGLALDSLTRLLQTSKDAPN